MNRKGSVSAKKYFSGPSKRFIAIITIIAASMLFYGFTPSGESEAQLTSVTIVDGDTCFEVETAGNTVADALCVAKVTVDENDKLSKDASENIYDGDTIIVTREKVMYLETGGKTFKILTQKNTVGEALLADGFQVGKYDEVIPDVYTDVTDGMTVRVARVSVAVYEVNEDIPFTEKRVNNDQKTVGYEKVVQEGQKGTKVRTFKKISKEGAGITATLIGENIAKAPVERIIEVGTKKPASDGTVTPSEGMYLTPGKTADGIPYSAIPTMAQNNSVTVREGNTAITASGTFTFKKVINAKATAYEGSAASNGQWAGMTATGRKPVYGVVAVDPKVIPLNSKLYIESADGGKSWVYGFAVAGDTGGAIKGNKIDLCYHTLSQCRQFGRRDAIVYILN